jgi:hypothetical protein
MCNLRKIKVGCAPQIPQIDFIHCSCYFTMKNYLFFIGTIFFLFNQKKNKVYTGFKPYTVKMRTIKKSNFLNFIIWNITFFSLIPFVSSSVAPFVDENYDSRQDLYDAILNTFFPIFFVILFNVSGKTGPIKRIFLPLLDDILYNMVTWVIPLIVSLAYDDLLGIKIFSFVNMLLHVVCATTAIIFRDNSRKFDKKIHILCTFFLIFFPVIVIPIFWTVIITTRHAFDQINIVLLVLLAILLVCSIFSLCLVGAEKTERIGVFTLIMLFYAPNIIQTLLIVINWPINFFFVKTCIFILVLSLTRNVSYFTDKVPDDFLPTSTTTTQQRLVDMFRAKSDKDEKEDEKKQDEIEKNETIKQMQKSINEMKETIDGLKKLVGYEMRNENEIYEKESI